MSRVPPGHLIRAIVPRQAARPVLPCDTRAAHRRWIWCNPAPPSPPDDQPSGRDMRLHQSFRQNAPPSADDAMRPDVGRHAVMHLLCHGQVDRPGLPYPANVGQRVRDVQRQSRVPCLRRLHDHQSVSPYVGRPEHGKIFVNRHPGMARDNGEVGLRPSGSGIPPRAGNPATARYSWTRHALPRGSRHPPWATSQPAVSSTAHPARIERSSGHPAQSAPAHPQDVRKT